MKKKIMGLLMLAFITFSAIGTASASSLTDYHHHHHHHHHHEHHHM